MRFLLSALALVALASTVSAQDFTNEELLNESDFDISGGRISEGRLTDRLTDGRIRSSLKHELKSSPIQLKQKIQAPVQQPKYEVPVKQERYEAPVQAKVELPVQQPKYEAPVQQPKYEAPAQVSSSPIMMKEKTFMLQPILMMPKQKAKATKMLNFDVDRAMAYRVSPKVSSENSRSVDISFTPILNAKMRNILLSGEEEVHSPREIMIETAPLQSSKYEAKQAPLQFQAPLQSALQQSNAWTGLQGISGFETPSSSYFSSPNVGGSGGLRFSGVSGVDGLRNVNEQFQFLNEQPISPRSYQFTQDVEQPLRFQSTFMNPYMTEDVDTNLLSSFDSSLPSVPITEKNIVSLGIQQPKKLNQMLKTCIANNVNTPVCAKVINSAKLLVRHNVANQVFDGIQI